MLTRGNGAYKLRRNMVDTKLKTLLRKRRLLNPRRVKLSVEQVAAILERLAYGHAVDDVAAEFSVHPRTVYRYWQKACE